MLVVRGEYLILSGLSINGIDIDRLIKLYIAILKVIFCCRIKRRSCLTTVVRTTILLAKSIVVRINVCVCVCVCVCVLCMKSPWDTVIYVKRLFIILFLYNVLMLFLSRIEICSFVARMNKEQIVDHIYTQALYNDFLLDSRPFI